MALPDLSVRLASRGRGLPVCAADDELRRHARLFDAHPELREALDALPDMVVVLNGRRQIVFANRWLLDQLSMKLDAVLGARAGEVLGCIHAWTDGTEGCGTTEACQACGALKSVRACEFGNADTHDARMLQIGNGTALDLRASSSPLNLGGESFTLLVLKDIAHENRRQALERLFFHDMLNTTASIMGYAELLSRIRREEVPEMGRLIARLVAELAGEIRAQRDLMLAERDDLKVQCEPVSSARMLAEAVEACRSHETAATTARLDPALSDVSFRSDRLLLARVLTNLIKNALEASPPGRDVTVGCTQSCGWVEFWVHNEGSMPRDVQLQVFQRSFSTKGPGRGLGTYSIKLLTERYLGGTVSFTSDQNAGTRFAARYPLSSPGCG